MFGLMPVPNKSLPEKITAISTSISVIDPVRVTLSVVAFVSVAVLLSVSGVQARLKN